MGLPDGLDTSLSTTGSDAQRMSLLKCLLMHYCLHLHFLFVSNNIISPLHFKVVAEDGVTLNVESAHSSLIVIGSQWELLLVLALGKIQYS